MQSKSKQKKTAKNKARRPGASGRRRTLRDYQPRAVKLAPCPVCAAPVGRLCRIVKKGGKPGAAIRGKVHRGRVATARRLTTVKIERFAREIDRTADDLISAHPALTQSKLARPLIISALAITLPLPPYVRARLLGGAARDALTVLLPADVLEKARQLTQEAAGEPEEENGAPMPYPAAEPPSEGESGALLAASGPCAGCGDPAAYGGTYCGGTYCVGLGYDSHTGEDS